MSLPELWEHQKKGIALSLELPNVGLFFDPGLGKTRCTIDILRRIFTNEKKIIPTIILGPIIVLENWKAEFAKYSKISEKKIFVCYGTGKQKMAILSDCILSDGILITNYESLLAEDFRQKILGWSPRLLVVDESQRCKNHASKRTKYVTQISDKTDYRYILSGTPVLNSPMDIYAQYRILDKGKTFGRNFFEFRARYFYDKNAGMPKQKHFPDWVIRKESFDELNKLIYKSAVRAVKAECLDLPPMLRQEYSVELSPKQKKAYVEMENNFVTFLKDNKGNDSAAYADLAITKALRMQQIVSGHIVDEDGKVIEFEDTPREKALEDLLEDITEAHQVLVWCTFKHNYEVVRRVCERLKIKYTEAHGGISNKEKFKAVEDFNTNPDYRVFIGHPGSLGVGINLIAASYSIYFSRNFSLENDIQSEARNYRGGSEIHESITRIDLVAQGTIDEQVLLALKNKMKVSEAVLDTYKGRI